MLIRPTVFAVQVLLLRISWDMQKILHGYYSYASEPLSGSIVELRLKNAKGLSRKLLTVNVMNTFVDM